MKKEDKFIGHTGFIILVIMPVLVLSLIILPSCSAGKKAAAVKASPANAQITPQAQSAVQGEPYVVVEEMPLFPGGDSALLAWISQNTRYPENARKNLVQGRVIVRFCVTSEGGVNKIAVLKGVSPELDAEAIRVVSALPAFTPGKQGGKPVDVWYMVPISFTLTKEPVGKEAVKN